MNLFTSTSPSHHRWSRAKCYSPFMVLRPKPFNRVPVASALRPDIIVCIVSFRCQHWCVSPTSVVDLLSDDLDYEQEFTHLSKTWDICLLDRKAWLIMHHCACAWNACHRDSQAFRQLRLFENRTQGCFHGTRLATGVWRAPSQKLLWMNVKYGYKECAKEIFESAGTIISCS